MKRIRHKLPLAIFTIALCLAFFVAGSERIEIKIKDIAILPLLLSALLSGCWYLFITPALQRKREGKGSQFPLAAVGFLISIIYWIIAWIYASDYSEHTGDILCIFLIIFVCGSIFWNSLIQLVAKRKET